MASEITITRPRGKMTMEYVVERASQQRSPLPPDETRAILTEFIAWAESRGATESARVFIRDRYKTLVPDLSKARARIAAGEQPLAVYVPLLMQKDDHFITDAMKSLIVPKSHYGRELPFPITDYTPDRIIGASGAYSYECLTYKEENPNYQWHADWEYRLPIGLNVPHKYSSVGTLRIRFGGSPHFDECKKSSPDQIRIDRARSDYMRAYCVYVIPYLPDGHWHDSDTWRGLCAAALADPNDALPRLIAADWLEENGDTDRAALIRFDCGGWEKIVKSYK